MGSIPTVSTSSVRRFGSRTGGRSVFSVLDLRESTALAGYARTVGGWRVVVIAAAVVAGAVAASGGVDIVPAALLVGAVVVGVHLTVGRGVTRLLRAHGSRRRDTR